MLGTKRGLEFPNALNDQQYQAIKRRRQNSHIFKAPIPRENRSQARSVNLFTAVAGWLHGLVFSTPNNTKPRILSPLKSRGLARSSLALPTPDRGTAQSDTSYEQTHRHQSRTVPRMSNTHEVVDLTADDDDEDDAGPSRPRQTCLSQTRHNKAHKPRLRTNGSDLVVVGERAARARAWDQQATVGYEEVLKRQGVNITEISSDEDEHDRRRATRRRDRPETQPTTLQVLNEALAKTAGGGGTDAERETKALRNVIRSLERDEEAKALQDRMMVRPSPSSHSTQSAGLDYAAYRQQLREATGTSDNFLQSARTRPYEPRRVRPSDSLVKAYSRDHALAEAFKRLDMERQKADDEYQALHKKPSVPSSLSQDELALVKQTMSKPAAFRSPKVYSECIESGNMSRLRVGQWLSDDIMAFYTGLILKRNSEDETLPNVHYFNTFFYSKLSTQGYSGLRRWTKKVDLFSKDLVLIPINVGNMHWIAAVINFRRKRFEYFDSMGDYGANMEDVFDNLHNYVKAEHKDKKGSEIDLSDWDRCHNKDAPRQNNGSDCGVFSCQTLELVARGADPIDKGFEFSSDNMKFFRELMVYEITKGELKKRW